MYFAGWGLAEQIRWVLAATNVEWDQVALGTHDEFVELRDVSCALAFGQLPLLEIDGMRLVQSHAIIRYVARRGGLVECDDAESVIIDMVAEAVRDARSGLSYPFDADSCRERLLSKQLPYLELAIRRGGGTIVPSGISYADVLIVEMIVGYVDMLGAKLLDDLPWLGALWDKVLSLEGIVGNIDQNIDQICKKIPSDVFVNDLFTLITGFSKSERKNTTMTSLTRDDLPKSIYRYYHSY
jgi:hypothetical protein